MLETAVDHLIHEVLPAADEYHTAEGELSRAFAADKTPSTWEPQARVAKRRAAQLAIATDGLADRCKNELGLSLTKIRANIEALCIWPGGTTKRPECLARVRGVANAYKHQDLTDPTLPITSDSDILVVGLGYGLEGYGVGKCSGVEVLVRDKTGKSWKFLGDAPVAVELVAEICTGR